MAHEAGINSPLTPVWTPVTESVQMHQWRTPFRPTCWQGLHEQCWHAQIQILMGLLHSISGVAFVQQESCWCSLHQSRGTRATLLQTCMHRYFCGLCKPLQLVVLKQRFAVCTSFKKVCPNSKLWIHLGKSAAALRLLFKHVHSKLPNVLLLSLW